MSLPISRIAASGHAKRITAGLDPDDIQLFADDPHDAVVELYGIDIVIHPPGHTIAGGCGVHGLYTPGDPPRIEITQSISRRRDGFTILHELGHHLARSDDTIIDELYELPDKDKRKSHELVADAIAGRLLVTDTDAHEAFGSGVTAIAMWNLFNITNASREACCVRGADALSQRGAVMLLRDNVAVFTSHRSTPWHVARSTPQAESGLLAQVAKGGHRTGETTVRFATGNTSTPMYADAMACEDGWVLAVLTLDRPAAGGLTIPLAKFAAEDGLECPECGFTFAPRGKPCVCGDYKCPNGHCGCDKGPPSKLCQSCFLQKHIELFEDGGEHCKDCS